MTPHQYQNIDELADQTVTMTVVSQTHPCMLDILDTHIDHPNHI